MKCPEDCPLLGSPTVFGDGPRQARILILGRNPGEEEAKHGKPFIGPAGRRLATLLDQLNLQRQEVYITNLVKCFTLRNAAPPKAAIEKCAETYLVDEIDEVHPDIIIALGREASSWAKKSVSPPTTVFCCVHPSAALRQPIFDALLRLQTDEIKSFLEGSRKLKFAEVNGNIIEWKRRK